MSTVEEVAQILGATVNVALDFVPFGGLLKTVACGAFQLSQHLDDLHEKEHKARKISGRCKMISTILLEHAEALHGCEYILKELQSCIESE